MFDDLIPNTNTNTQTAPPAKGGGSLSFDDLVPVKKDKKTSNVPVARKIANPQAENNAWFKSKQGDSALTSVAKGVGNIIPSTIGIAKGLWGAFRHPIDTVTNISNLVAGTAGAGAKYVAENTDLGQKFLEKANEVRKANGVPLLVVGEDGKIQAENTEQMDQADAVGGYFKDRYGSAEGIKRSAVEDPAGVALDISSLFDGGASLAGRGAKIAEVAGMAKTASTLNKTATVANKVSEVINPINTMTRVAKPVVTRKLTDVNDLLKKSGKELQSDALKEGLYGMNETVGSLKQRFEDTTYKYKTPTGEIVDVNPIDTLVQYDLIPQPARGGSLDVTKIKSKIPTLKKELDGQIDSILKTDGQSISIDDYAKQLDASIENLNKSKMFKTELAGKIDSELETLAKAYPDGEIPLDEINKIRKEANGEFRDDKIDLARIRGNATREIVYNATPDQAVRSLLNEQRKLINAEDYASKLAMHKVKGGRLGNYVYTTLGAIVGGSTKLPFGIGETIGAVGGRALSEVLQRRQLRSATADIKSGLEKVVGRPMKVDVTKIPEKMGIDKLLGQKSPNSTPASNTAKTTPMTDGSMEDIIPKNELNVNSIKEQLPLLTELAKKVRSPEELKNALEYNRRTDILEEMQKYQSMGGTDMSLEELFNLLQS